MDGQLHASSGVRGYRGRGYSGRGIEGREESNGGRVSGTLQVEKGV